METNEQLIKYLQNEFTIQLSPKISIDDVIATIAAIVNDLIQNDFHKLVNILYRLDISENKLKYLLQLHKTEDAGNIIASLIVERELQKITTRRQFSKKNKDISEDDKW